MHLTGLFYGEPILQQTLQCNQVLQLLFVNDSFDNGKALLYCNIYGLENMDTPLKMFLLCV